MIRLLAVCSLFVLVGCGSDPVGTVTGKVTYNNQPVTSGSVVFQSDDGRTSVSANLDSSGSYQIVTAEREGLPPGNYKVAVRPGQIGSGETPLATQPGQSAPAAPTVPTQYHSVDTSGLTATVKEGDNPPFNFDLKD